MTINQSIRKGVSALLLSLFLALLTTGLLLHNLGSASAAPRPQIDESRRGATYTQSLPAIFQPLGLDPIELTCNSNDWQLDWGHSGTGIEYFEVQESHFADFSTPNTYTTTNTFYDFSNPAGINSVYYYRVRAIVGGNPAQWSNTEMVVGAYLDNFNTPGTGWPVGNLGPAIHSYVNGKYAIETLFAGFLNGTLAPDVNRTDYVVSAAMNFHPTFPTDGTYGLVFGSNQDASHFYFLAVYPSFGDFRIWRWDGTLYAVSPFTVNAAINAGSGVNAVEVARIGNNIKVTINGVPAGTWTDATLTGGTRAGVFVSPQEDNPVIQARFDNFGLQYCGDINEARLGQGSTPPATELGLREALPFSIPFDFQHP